MSMASILIVDDDKNFSNRLKNVLSTANFKKVFCVESIESMLAVIRMDSIDVILLDNHLGQDIQGCDYIKEIKKIRSDIEIIMLTSNASSRLIIKAIQEDAFYYLIKDQFDTHELIKLIGNAKSKKEREAITSAYEYLEENKCQYHLIEDSSHYAQIKEKIKKIARMTVGSNLLVVGENSVGKTEVAKYYYSLIKRPDEFRPFFRFDSIDLSDESFKEVFYGSKDKKSIIEISNMSVVLLKNIEKLDRKVQSLLLSFLKDSEITLTNGNKRDNSVVVIATTSSDLLNLVNEGCFEKELYYDLSSVDCKVAPLRERREDILLLSKYFSNKMDRKYFTKFPPLPESISKLLVDYDWPGNIAELKYVLEKLFSSGFDDGKFNENELPSEILFNKRNIDDLFPNRSDEEELLRDIIRGSQSYKERETMFKKLVIDGALKKNDYSMTKTLKLLKISRTTLYREIKNLNLNCKED